MKKTLKFVQQFSVFLGCLLQIEFDNFIVLPFKISFHMKNYANHCFCFIG